MDCVVETLPYHLSVLDSITIKERTPFVELWLKGPDKTIATPKESVNQFQAISKEDQRGQSDTSSAALSLI